MKKDKINNTAVSDEEIVAALLRSGSLAQAAEITQLSPRALYDRMSYREFQVLYTAAKSDIIRAAVNGLCSDLATACQTIRDILVDKETRPETRLQAAKLFIDSAVRLSEYLQTVENQTASYTHTALDMDFDRI